ncbi:thioredoxin domain-containing protein [Favolaschia claudopus]|uniref:Thioredoxin domain-containing protein n=1 Tax=Favolaschia claudopus TaxID=2862362 RepID=A0AAW0CFN3_9AGAR
MAALRLASRNLLAKRTFVSTSCRKVHYINATKATFDQVASNGSDDRLVLVDFYADWCGPCHALSPILKSVTDGSDNLDLVTIDVENESGGGSELAQQFQVSALPTVVAFRGGKQVDKFVGALRKNQVQEFLDKL